MSAKYVSNAAGWRELGRSSGVQGATMQAANRIASAARQVDSEGTYSVTRATVTAGWDNELRAGAVVADETGSGARKRSLLKGIEAAKE